MISVITTFTTKRKDAWQEALLCYCDFADEVVVVYDPEETEITKFIAGKNIVPVYMDWDFEYSWEEFPRHFNAGLEKAKGDWVVKMDIDLLIHENDLKELRERLVKGENRVASMQKMSVYGNKYYSKGEVVNCLRKGGDSPLQFGGIIGGANDDLAGIIEVDHINKSGVPMGKAPYKVTRTGIGFWNFDYAFKDEDSAHRDFARMARAYRRYFQSNLFGEDDQDSIKVYNQLRIERYRKAVNPLNAEMLPKYIREKYLQEYPL